MRVLAIRANNFKSLVDFRIDLADFTCLIGLNGAGKSTVLQFVDFLGQQVRGDLEGWLSERSWRAKDLKSQLTKKKNNIDFSVELADESGQHATWEASFNPIQLQCTHERIRVGNAHLDVSGGSVQVVENVTGPTVPGAGTSSSHEITFTYQGSILSQLKESALPAPLLDFKQFLRNVESLDLLSPEHLRQRTRGSSGSLGIGGRRLSAFLHELGAERRRTLVRRLRSVYPQLKDVYTRALRSGWKQLEITEAYKGARSGLVPAMTTEARHVADGMLRVIAVLSEIETDHRLLLFDEIENGINPELIEFVLDALVQASQQVLVTTHSPMILNYLEDDVAREGVVYLHKTIEGYTRAVRFFDIPSLAEKLTVMGPGEAFADTDLSALGDEIHSAVADR